MIYITRPVVETHKTVPKTLDRPVDKTFIDEDISRDGRNTYYSDQGQGRHFTKEELEAAIDDANQIVALSKNKFKFEIHERTNRIMVKVLDEETEEIIREMPPEKILDLIGDIWDLVGILVDERG